MTWSSFWEPILPFLFGLLQCIVLGLVSGMLLVAAFWLLVALLTIGDMIRSGEIGRWCK